MQYFVGNLLVYKETHCYVVKMQNWNYDWFKLDEKITFSNYNETKRNGSKN